MNYIRRSLTDRKKFFSSGIRLWICKVLVIRSRSLFYEPPPLPLSKHVARHKAGLARSLGLSLAVLRGVLWGWPLGSSSGAWGVAAGVAR